MLSRCHYKENKGGETEGKNQKSTKKVDIMVSNKKMTTQKKTETDESN